MATKKFGRFLTPTWILTTIFVLIFTYFALSFLAPWQLGKNQRRSEFNARVEKALSQDPVPVTDVFTGTGGSGGEDTEWRHVRMQGHFLPGHEVLLRNRPVDGAPAYQVLTPFALTTDSDFASPAAGQQRSGGESAAAGQQRSGDSDATTGHVVLVNRGFIPLPGAREKLQVPAAPTGQLTITGFVRRNENPHDQGVMQADGRAQTLSINTQQVAESQHLRLAEDYVQLDEASATAGVNALGLPKLESGPYLSYGIQWIVFGILAPLGLGWFIFAEVRERRREKQEAAELAAGKALAGEGGVVEGEDPSGALPDGAAKNGAAHSGVASADGAANAGDAGDADAVTRAASTNNAGSAASTNNADSAASTNNADSADSAATTTEQVMHNRYGTAKKRRFGQNKARGGERF